MIDNEIKDRLEDFNENSLTFMYQSIADTQSIIRAIDTKLGFILVLNLVPITNIGKIFFKIQNIISTDHDPTIHLIKTVISIICIICWLIACWCIYKGISAIASLSNPNPAYRRMSDLSELFNPTSNLDNITPPYKTEKELVNYNVNWERIRFLLEGKLKL
jgi:hypothetical protein